MESIVKNILEELYILEPNLRKQEKKLVNIIELMTKNIPKSEMNIEFKNKLRKEILSKIHSSKSKYYTLYLPILSGISKQWVYTHDGCMKNQNRWVSSNK